jgi:hypothetical protein
LICEALRNCSRWKSFPCESHSEEENNEIKADMRAAVWRMAAVDVEFEAQKENYAS